MTKIIFIDIDGTLCLGDDINPKTIKTINDYKRHNDCKIVLCTGRPYNNVIKLFKKNKLDYDFMVSVNGAVIFNYMGKVIFKRPLSKDQIFDTLRFAKKNGMEVTVKTIYNEFSTVLKKDSKILIKQSKAEGKKYYNFISYSDVKKEASCNNLVGINLFTDKDTDDIIKRFDVKGLVLAKGLFYLLDVYDQDVSKGVAVDFVKRLYNDSLTISIGDNGNDIPMFTHTDFSIAMGQSSDDVKSHATYTTKSVDELGVVYAFENIIPKCEKNFNF